MIPQRWTGRPNDARAAGPPLPPAINWSQWLRTTERKRRQLERREGRASRASRAFLDGYYVAATDCSFRLEGLVLHDADLTAALTPGWARRSLGGRQQQRVRNHVAILRSIEHMLGREDALKLNDVVRWYTSVACGLSTTRLDAAAAARLDGVVQQVNSPHLRLAPAVQGIARLHHQLLREPVVPSFNGILARLLLRWHLGRCGLPPVVFDAVRDGGMMVDESKLLARLLELIDQSYDALLAD
jgi:hypothetical protein